MASILIFTWNADGLRICETLSESKAKQNRKGFVGLIRGRPPCITANFLERIRIMITERNPELVVFSTQEESDWGTYLHSDLLPSFMESIPYTRLEKGKEGRNRLSLYSNNPLTFTIKAQGYFSSETTQTCSDGNVVMLAIQSNTVGSLCFISLNLWSAFEKYKNLSYLDYRAAARSSNNLCLLQFKGLVNWGLYNHVFIFGDFNCDVFIPDVTRQSMLDRLSIDQFRQYDEFNELKKLEPLAGFLEGVDGRGPTFPPNWNLKINRPDGCGEKAQKECYSNITTNNTGIGWHERIVYSSRSNLSGIRCSLYESLDVGNIKQSNHSAVVGLYRITN